MRYGGWCVYLVEVPRDRVESGGKVGVGLSCWGCAHWGGLGALGLIGSGGDVLSVGVCSVGVHRLVTSINLSFRYRGGFSGILKNVIVYLFITL